MLRAFPGWTHASDEVSSDEEGDSVPDIGVGKCLRWLFWGVAAADISLLFFLFLRVFDGHLPGVVLVVLLPVGLFPLLMVIGICALLRNNIFYIIGMVLMVSQLLWFGMPQIKQHRMYMAMVESEQSGRAYFDTKPEQELAAAIIACDTRYDTSKCDFARIDRLARVANVNMVARDKSFMELAIDGGGSPDVIASLLRAGETNGVRAAMRVGCMNPEVARAALAAGVDPNIRTTDGTPYIIECLSALAFFIDAGADINAVAPDGHTALMEAVAQLRFDAVALLLAHGAREDQVMKDGRTLDSMIAKIPPELLQSLRPELDAFVKRHRPQ